jgi:hypothetical protein
VTALIVSVAQAAKSPRQLQVTIGFVRVSIRLLVRFQTRIEPSEWEAQVAA